MLSDVFARARAEQRTVFIPYIMGGDPTIAASFEIVIELSALGAGIIELGIPFSDPIADGPTIAAAAQRALANGATVESTMQLAERCARARCAPLVLFSYFNPVLQYGIRRFARDAARAGALGAIIPDLPLEEAGALQSALAEHGLEMPLFVAPNTNRQRMRRIAQCAGGFVYVVTRPGVTGEERQPEISHVAARIAALREVTEKPLAVGFGIRDPEQIRHLATVADGVIVGSALIGAYADRSCEQAAGAVAGYARELMSHLQPIGEAV